MKKLILILLFLLLQTTNTFACMPHSPANLITGIYEGIETRKHPDGNVLQFIKLKDVNKPFAGDYTKLGKYYFLHSDDNDEVFSMKNYMPGDLIIAIADYNNGSYEDYFAVYEIGKLEYINGKYEIEEKQGTIKNWGKKLWWCGNFKSDNVMDENELLNEVSSYLDIGVPINIQKNIDKMIYFTIFGFIILLLLLIKYVYRKNR